MPTEESVEVVHTVKVTEEVGVRVPPAEAVEDPLKNDEALKLALPPVELALTDDKGEEDGVAPEVEDPQEDVVNEGVEDSDAEVLGQGVEVRVSFPGAAKLCVG